MNLNRDLIHNLEGQKLNKTISEIKNITGKIIDELAPGTSKDLKKGLMAEDSIGRASFSMLKKATQSELGGRIDRLNKLLKFDEFSYGRDKYLKEACTINGQFDERLVSIAEEFTTLAKNKPEKLSFCWETYIPDITAQTKNNDGTINKEIYEAIKELFVHEKISTRGIDNIIKGSTEWIREPNGNLHKKFNKEAFGKFKEFMDLNGKTMHEQDDVFTLYLGETLNACTKQDSWVRQGEDYIFDNVAFNFAKRLYEQGEDIIHMDFFMKNFHQHIEENGRHVLKGFKFETKREEYWSKKMIENLKNGLSEDTIEICKVDGKDSLHNLLVADTLKKDSCRNSWELKHIIEKLKDKDGYVPTDYISYLCRNESKTLLSGEYDILHCINKNGSVNGNVWQRICDKKIISGDIQLTKVNNEFSYENLDILETLSKNIREQEKYQSYHVQDVFNLLKNKDGIVDKKLLEPLDELLELTHLAPKELKDCIKSNGEVDRILLELKKECIKKHSTFHTTFTDIVRNADGSANPQGVEITKLMLEAGLPNEQKLVNTYRTKDGFDYDGIRKFLEEYKNTDKNFREKTFNMSVTGEYQSTKEVRTIDIEKFKALKEAMLHPEIAPLMKNHTNAFIIGTKYEPFKYNGKDTNIQRLYHLKHLKRNDVEILEKNGYPARFYKALGYEKKYSIDVLPHHTQLFEKEFIIGNKIEQQLEKIIPNETLQLNYTTEQLGNDINSILQKLPEKDALTLKRVFKLSINGNNIEGFPQRFEAGTKAPQGLEEAFTSINSSIHKFYNSSVKSDSTEYSKLCDEIIEGLPEFKMLIGKIGENGERIDVKTLKKLQELVSTPEYKSLSQEDKTVSKLTVLLHEIGRVDTKPQTVKKQFMSDNDGIAVYINSEWSKGGEYVSSILERYNLSEQAKYRTVQLISDIGWAKKLEKGELNPLDIATNQRYKGDEIVSPLIEKIITGECKYDKGIVAEKIKQIRTNQQVLFTPTMKELEPYIETTEINGEVLKYVNLDRPELKDKPILAHFLGYDGLDHTLDILKNKAYRSAFSASLVKGGHGGHCFAGRNTGIALEFDNVNIANISHTNINSGFGKVYKHLKESLTSSATKEVKQIMKDELKLSNDEYGILMDKIINSKTEKEITDCVINGKSLSKEEIINAYQKGINEVLRSVEQNETTVLNARPFATIGIGESINSFEVRDAVSMAQSNDMIMLFKKRN